MNKQQAQNIIRETFESPFDKGRFTGFIKNLLNRIDEGSFIYKGNYIPDAYKQYIKTLERIGKFNDGENSLDILVITLQKETSLERARTMQRNFIAWYLNGSRGGSLKDAALVAYVSPDQADWRFSLVKMDYTFEKTKSGKMKVKEEFTPARRWSFLMGANEKSHTAQSRLVNILADDDHAPTLAELENAFDIETVTREFFLKYRDLFLRTKEALDKVVANDPKVKADFEAKGVDTVNFAKKLLGQIVFLYFLQKKGWFGVGRDDDWGTGSKDFLRQLFAGTHGGYQNFFNDILEPLFYEALRIDRSHDDDYYSRFNCKIPFLNGGLFDPIGNYDWVHTDIHLPNDLFSNSRKTKEGDEGDGILDVFDRYNFTVREDEPLEKEVAIDPELLGKAYEKFNAIRPDNFDEFTQALKSGKKGEENKFNKKFGVYYTPREIVHYMCRQSLINYLFTQAEETGFSGVIQKQDMEDLIEVGELITEHEATALIKQEKIKNGSQKSTEYTALLPDSIRENVAAIDKWLEEITVCDPAVGSGAFPVGMMNEIVRARNVLSVFLKECGRSDYEFKRRCIEHSLYGVDIDPGAVEIAKLRLWLSLVVDEEDIKNIKPLPNLDYKIVCGNSLIGVEKDLFNHQLLNDLEKLKPLFFTETNPTKKQGYKNQIDELISKITKGHTEFDFEVYFSEVFHEKGGFDVVIGNPPYVRIQELKKSDARIAGFLKSAYASARKGNYDLYVVFVEKGLQLLNGGGHFAFILPHKFFNAQYGEPLRKVISRGKHLRHVVHFGDQQIFEGVTNYVCLLFLAKGGVESCRWVRADDLPAWMQTFHAPEIDLPTKRVTAAEWNYAVGEGAELFEKLQAMPVKLGDIADVFVGLQTSADDVFIMNFISETARTITLESKALGKPWTFEKELLHPVVSGTDVAPYAPLPARQFILFPYRVENEQAELIPFANISSSWERMAEYLKENKHRLESREGGRFRDQSWHRFGRSQNLGIQERAKLCVPRLVEYLHAGADLQGTHYLDNVDVGGVTFKDPTASYSLTYLLALLNSQVLRWFFPHVASPFRGGFRSANKQFLSLLPFRPINFADATERTNHQAVERLVDRILGAKARDATADVSALEREIDQMVYQLYGLTEDEIKIVEGETA